MEGSSRSYHPPVGTRIRSKLAPRLVLLQTDADLDDGLRVYGRFTTDGVVTHRRAVKVDDFVTAEAFLIVGAAILEEEVGTCAMMTKESANIAFGDEDGPMAVEFPSERYFSLGKGSDIHACGSLALSIPMTFVFPYPTHEKALWAHALTSFRARVGQARAAAPPSTIKTESSSTASCPDTGGAGASAPSSLDAVPPLSPGTAQDWLTPPRAALAPRQANVSVAGRVLDYGGADLSALATSTSSSSSQQQQSATANADGHRQLTSAAGTAIKQETERTVANETVSASSYASRSQPHRAAAQREREPRTNEPDRYTNADSKERLLKTVWIQNDIAYRQPLVWYCCFRSPGGHYTYHRPTCLSDYMQADAIMIAGVSTPRCKLSSCLKIEKDGIEIVENEHRDCPTIIIHRESGYPFFTSDSIPMCIQLDRMNRLELPPPSMNGAFW